LKELYNNLLARLLLFTLFYLLFWPDAIAQSRHHNRTSPLLPAIDTLRLPAGVYFLTSTSYLIIPRDTSVLINTWRRMSSEELSQLRSGRLYDSLYARLHHRKLGKMLYDLAFVPPDGEGTLPDSVQSQKNDIPFLSFQGKVISGISIKVLSPFGTSLSDTLLAAQSRAARFGNATHINTRKSVIRHQLLIKPGDRFDPREVADNLRIIRDLPYISEASFLITESAPGSDTVNITVIAKDNWSIGGNLTVIDLTRYRGSLYDGNFLGSGDRFTVSMSVNGKRAPFFRFDGISYAFTNIYGSFIDLQINLSQDDQGNRQATLSATRPFFSYATKYAGGLSVSMQRQVSENADGTNQVGDYLTESGWFGRSYPLLQSDPTTRFVVTGGFLNRHFYNRPVVTIDSNIGFYNNTSLLGSVMITRNQYYNTNYIMRFGLMESLPYGFFTGVTFGPVITDFYTRFYGNIGLSSGNFIGKFGYLYGNLNIGGYLNRDQFEDGLLKIKLQYMSNIYFSRDHRYRFRSLVNTQLGYQINPRSNNRDIDNLPNLLDLRIKSNDTLYQGNRLFTASYSAITYTPWYFYGFRFGLQATLEIGLVSKTPSSPFSARFVSGIGFSLLIQNDNLILPPIQISCFFYPSSTGVPPVQLDLNQVSDITFADFSPHAPRIESLQN